MVQLLLALDVSVFKLRHYMEVRLEARQAVVNWPGPRSPQVVAVLPRFGGGITFPVVPGALPLVHRARLGAYIIQVLVNYVEAKRRALVRQKEVMKANPSEPGWRHLTCGLNITSSRREPGLPCNRPPPCS
jgi:hypothetical protein